MVAGRSWRWTSQKDKFGSVLTQESISAIVALSRRDEHVAPRRAQHSVYCDALGRKKGKDSSLNFVGGPRLFAVLALCNATATQKMCCSP